MRIQPSIQFLEAVLEQVRKVHPTKAELQNVEVGSFLDEIRLKLKESSYNDLTALAFEFNSKKMMACLEILFIDKEGDIPKKAAEILKIRPRDNVIVKGWYKITKHYPHNLIEKTLRELMVKNEFTALEGNKKISPALPRWFISKTLTAGILHDYQISGDVKNIDTYLKHNHLKEREGLFKACWQTLMMKGNAESLKKEKADRILFELIKPENAPFHIPIAQHYLNVLKRINWYERLLKFIADKYGTPLSVDTGQEIDTPFWKKVNKRAKEEFNTWYISKSIDEFFEGDRADFWKKYVQINKVKRVKKILNGEGFLIDFGVIGVVEFKNIGNAAYIYTPKAFAEYWSMPNFSDRPESFKDKDKTIRHRSFSYWDGRIIHRKDWQADTIEKINRLIGIR